MLGRPEQCYYLPKKVTTKNHEQVPKCAVFSLSELLDVLPSTRASGPLFQQMPTSALAAGRQNWPKSPTTHRQRPRSQHWPLPRLAESLGSAWLALLHGTAPALRGALPGRGGGSLQRRLGPRPAQPRAEPGQNQRGETRSRAVAISPRMLPGRWPGTQRVCSMHALRGRRGRCHSGMAPAW